MSHCSRGSPAPSPSTGSAASLGAVIVIVLLGAAAGAGGEAADDFNIPGTESQEALDLFRAHSPAFAGADSTLVFTVDGGKVTDAGPRAAITGALEKVRGLDGVEQVADPFARGGTVSRDGGLAAVEVRYSTEPQDLEKADGVALLKAADTAERDGVQVSARGVLIDLASEQDAPIGELIGVGVAIILLTLLFRSLAAMAATLVGALLGVMVGQILLVALAKPLALPQFAAVIAVMLGLGAGIDYALLIIGRYREQIAAGDSPRDASAKAAATSGASVVAAGVIVMVAIAGLLVIGIPLIGKLGIAAAIGVGAVVVSALTVLPIMMGALAKRLRPKKPEHVRPSAALRALGPDGHGAAVAVDRRRRARAARLRRAGHAAAARPARRRQPAGGQVPAGRLRQPQQGVRPRLQRPVPARGRHPQGRREPTRPSSPSSRRPSRTRRAS